MAADFGENVKTAILKGIEAIGKGAASLAEGAHKKLDEMELENRRREILNEIPQCVNELFEQGIELPGRLGQLLEELANVDERLSAMRPAPQAPVKEPEVEVQEAPAEAEASVETEETPMPQPEPEPAEEPQEEEKTE